MFGTRLGAALSVAAMVLCQGIHSNAGKSVDQQTVGGRTMRDGGSELMRAGSASMAHQAGGAPSASARKGTVGGRSTSVLSSKMRGAARKRNMIIGIAIGVAILFVLLIVVGIVLYKKYKAPKPKGAAGNSNDKEGDEKKKLVEGEKGIKSTTDEQGLDGKESRKTKTTPKPKGGGSTPKPKGGGSTPKPKGDESTPKPTISGPGGETTSEKSPKESDGQQTGTTTVSSKEGTDPTPQDRGKEFDPPSRDPDITLEFWLAPGSNATPKITGSADDRQASIDKATQFILTNNETTQDLENFLNDVQQRHPQVFKRLKDRGLDDVHDWLAESQEVISPERMPTEAGPEAAKLCLAPLAASGVKEGIVSAITDLKLPMGALTIEQVSGLNKQYLVDDEEVKKRVDVISEGCKRTEYSSPSEKEAEEREYRMGMESVQLASGKMRHVDGVIRGMSKKNIEQLFKCTPAALAEVRKINEAAKADNADNFGVMQLLYGLPATDDKLGEGPSIVRDMVAVCHNNPIVVTQAQQYVFEYAKNEAYGRVIDAVSNIPKFEKTLEQMRGNYHFGKRPVKAGIMGDRNELVAWMDRRQFCRGTGEGIGHESD